MGVDAFRVDGSCDDGADQKTKSSIEVDSFLPPPMNPNVATTQPFHTHDLMPR
jgi:hypothetical protein